MWRLVGAVGIAQRRTRRGYLLAGSLLQELGLGSIPRSLYRNLCLWILSLRLALQSGQKHVSLQGSECIVLLTLGVVKPHLLRLEDVASKVLPQVGKSGSATARIDHDLARLISFMEPIGVLLDEALCRTLLLLLPEHLLHHVRGNLLDNLLDPGADGTDGITREVVQELLLMVGPGSVLLDGIERRARNGFEFSRGGISVDLVTPRRIEFWSLPPAGLLLLGLLLLSLLLLQPLLKRPRVLQVLLAILD